MYVGFLLGASLNKWGLFFMTRNVVFVCFAFDLFVFCIILIRFLLIWSKKKYNFMGQNIYIYIFD